MKIVQTAILIDAGGFGNSREWKHRYEQICQAIETVEWPPGSGAFTLYDQAGRKRGEGNGVKPIKDLCMARLRDDFGWSLETRTNAASLKVPGPMDATCSAGTKVICVEWETGNVSSSHRALNKMCLGILTGVLVGGVLILPTRKMYHYLTDRVGNFAEVEPYFPLWRSIAVREGILVAIAIEHDSVSLNVPRIKKGTDGRALQ